MYPELPPRRVLSALALLGAVAVTITGSLLLWRYRTATLDAAADREAVLVAARANALGDELGALVAEVERLSRLADVDLADGNLEPEKTVLRLARRDEALFSVRMAILDSGGEVLWAEPRDARPAAPGPFLVGLARAHGHAAVHYGQDAIEVAAPVAGQGALVALVDARDRDLFGPDLRHAVTRRGAVVLVLPGRRGQTVVAATGAAPGGLAPGVGVAAAGQSWVSADGERWLVTTASVPSTGLLLRLEQPAGEVEGALSATFRRLVALVAAVIAASVAGGLLLARLALRLDRTELALARASELAAMGKTSAAIAHEVKNALNGLSVSVDLLAAGRTDAATRAAVHGRARAEIGRLREVADDLTLFAATPHLSRAPVDAGALVHQAAEAVAELAEECGVRVEVDAAEGLPSLEADGPKLLLALVNLARNGIEAMGPGAFGERLGEVAPARERRLDLAARRSDRGLELEVSDRGAGLAPGVRARLFEPFVTTKRTGTGLGLAIVRKVVEAHRGEVRAEDRPGGGATFRVLLPARAGEEVEA